jgi:hypothetical protein
MRTDAYYNDTIGIPCTDNIVLGCGTCVLGGRRSARNTILVFARTGHISENPSARDNDTVGRTNRIVIKRFYCTVKSLSLRSAFKEL